MAENRMFRNALFGGFNKEDVNEYIKTLENEIEAIKVLHQKEKNDLMRQIDQGRGAADTEQVSKLQEELVSVREELNASREEKRTAEDQLKSLQFELETAKGRLNAAKDEPGQEKTVSDSSMYEEALAQGKEELRGKEEQLREMEARLREKEEQLKEKDRELEDLRKRGKADGFIDYSMIGEVLKDARKTAEMIEKDAHDKADGLIKQAEQDASAYRQEMETKINAELETKGIQLFAAKHKINQCANEVRRIQESLYNIYVGMDNMATNMPTRLDHYWAGEKYKELMDSSDGEEKLMEEPEEKSEKAEEKQQQGPSQDSEGQTSAPDNSSNQ